MAGLALPVHFDISPSSYVKCLGLLTCSPLQWPNQWKQLTSRTFSVPLKKDWVLTMMECLALWKIQRYSSKTSFHFGFSTSHFSYFENSTWIRFVSTRTGTCFWRILLQDELFMKAFAVIFEHKITFSFSLILPKKRNYFLKPLKLLPTAFDES